MHDPTPGQTADGRVGGDRVVRQRREGLDVLVPDHVEDALGGAGGLQLDEERRADLKGGRLPPSVQDASEDQALEFAVGTDRWPPRSGGRRTGRTRSSSARARRAGRFVR